MGEKTGGHLIDTALMCLDRCGGWGLAQGRRLGGHLHMLGNALLGFPLLLGPAGYYMRRTVVQQVYFTAVQAFGLINVIGLAVGVLVALPLLQWGVTDVNVQARVMQVVLFNQLAPFLSALVVIGRSGTALTAELAEFHYSGVTISLQLLGLNTDQFLILPRLLGVTFSLCLLTLWTVVSSVIGAGLYYMWHGVTSFSEFVRVCISIASPLSAVMSVGMLVTYGVAIVLIQSRLGLEANNVVELQRNLPKAFVHSLLACIGLTLLFIGVQL